MSKTPILNGDAPIPYDEIQNMASVLAYPELLGIAEAFKAYFIGDRSPEFYHGMMRGISFVLACENRFETNELRLCACSVMSAKCAELIIEKVGET